MCVVSIIGVRVVSVVMVVFCCYGYYCGVGVIAIIASISVGIIVIIVCCC